MTRAAALVNGLLEFAATLLLVALCAVTFLGVIDRYVLHTGIGWTEELARFLLIWASLVSAALVVYREGHFRIAVLVDLLPPRLRATVFLLIHLVTMGVLAVVAFQGAKVTQVMQIQTSPALDLPMTWIYVSLPLSTGIMLLFLLPRTLVLMRSVAGKEAPGHASPETER
jgi:TRAP-type C4-dicarboxylate transport system permease small subunit